MKNRTIIILLMLWLGSCKKPYNPPVTNAPASYLIVEGVINTNDTTKIKLSRTVNLSNSNTVNPVTGAGITVESDGSAVYYLTETSAGQYTLPGVSLNTSGKYRLRIKTADGKEYLSDFEDVKITPPIDSIGFNLISSGLQIYANTHDPANNTHYYRYDYNETWAFHSMYYSEYYSDGTSINPRGIADDIYHCFANNTSSTIVLASSAKLTQDVISEAPVTAIESTSEKIESKYSILLRQYALTADAYKFWTNLKKNTEQLGSIFDAQPSQISGNIHNTANAKEPVVGYISVGTVASKRIFITNEQLLVQWRPAYPYQCELDTVLYSNKSGVNEVASFLIPSPHVLLPVEALKKGAAVIGYLASDKSCVDCTIRGYTRQPDFWK